MAPLGPFEPSPRLAVAVSGGADSLALAVLAHGWAAERGGAILALVIDHGLREASAAEAAITLERLAGLGIGARSARLDLPHGPALSARARRARHAALESLCASRGIVHLLLGHHAGDQAETVLMRVLAGSAEHGLAGMAALRETSRVRVLRPLLEVAPGRLRATLRAAGIGWLEDPSNADPRTLRAQLRAWRADPQGDGRATRALVASAAAAGQERAAAERGVAAVLAGATAIRPEGFAILRPGPLDPRALAALIQAVSGRPYAPSMRQTALLAGDPRPATLSGARLLPAGRLGPGLLLVREEAAMQAAVPAGVGAWDGRFRIAGAPDCPALSVGAVGPAAAGLRGLSSLPAVVLRTLPALRLGATLVAVPHLRHSRDGPYARVSAAFSPPRPAAPAAFLAA